MTTPTAPPEVDVKGRMIKVKQLNDAQLLLLARESRLAMNQGTEPGRRMAAIGRLFDILESIVVEDADKEYLMDITVKGDLELADMTPFISAFQDNEEDDEKPKVRRGGSPTKRS